jgi:hypothetical protein
MLAPMYLPRAAILAATVALLALGCSSNNPVEQNAGVTPAASAPSTDKPIIPDSVRHAAEQPAKTEQSKPPEPPKSTDAAPTPTLADNVPEEKPAIAQYTPPFPDRVDLFVPPKRQGGARVKEGEVEDHVELLGFIRVDRPQVVLSVNGQITAIPEGATQFGVEVISIQEPKVVLQRGRQRWQASIEN